MAAPNAPAPAAAQASGPSEFEHVIEEPPSAEQHRAVEVPLASEASQERLGAWLEYAARGARQDRNFSGVNLLLGSAAGMGVGVWAYIRSDPRTELDKGLGLALVAASGVTMAVGIVRLAKASTAEQRRDRWESARGPDMTNEELARFEGELRSQSERAERSLRVKRWMNLAVGLTGGLVLGLTPAANLSRDGRTIGYVLGGVAAGLGFFGFTMSFVGPRPINYWQVYKQGLSPAQPNSRARLTTSW